MHLSRREKKAQRNAQQKAGSTSTAELVVGSTSSVAVNPNLPSASAPKPHRITLIFSILAMLPGLMSLGWQLVEHQKRKVERIVVRPERPKLHDTYLEYSVLLINSSEFPIYMDQVNMIPEEAPLSHSANPTISPVTLSTNENASALKESLRAISDAALRPQIKIVMSCDGDLDAKSIAPREARRYFFRYDFGDLSQVPSRYTISVTTTASASMARGVDANDTVLLVRSLINRVAEIKGLANNQFLLPSQYVSIMKGLLPPPLAGELDKSGNYIANSDRILMAYAVAEHRLKEMPGTRFDDLRQQAIITLLPKAPAK